jgi:hypothetical protein
MEEEIRLIHTKLNDGKITVTQATELIINLIKKYYDFKRIH